MNPDQFRLSARSLAGNGLGAVPLHYIDAAGCLRGSYPVRDAAGIAAAILGGHRGLAEIEAACLAASHDCPVAAVTVSAPQRWTTATLRLAMHALRRLAMRRKGGCEALALEAD
jgi:hypothetical protein